MRCCPRALRQLDDVEVEFLTGRYQGRRGSSHFMAGGPPFRFGEEGRRVRAADVAADALHVRRSDVENQVPVKVRPCDATKTSTNPRSFAPMRANAAASPSVMATSLAATATCLGKDALRRRAAAATRASSSVTTRWPFSAIPSKGDLSLASVATNKASRGARTLRAASTLLWPLNWKSFSRSWRLLYAASAPLTAGGRLAVEPGDDGRGGTGHAVAVADEVADQPLVQVLLGVIHKIDVGVEGHEQPTGAVDVPPVRAVRAPAGRAHVGDDGVGPVAEDFIAVDGVAPQPFNAF